MFTRRVTSSSEWVMADKSKTLVVQASNDGEMTGLSKEINSG
jgi:hypothetical protein